MRTWRTVLCSLPLSLLTLCPLIAQERAISPQPFYDDFSDSAKFQQNWHKNEGFWPQGRTQFVEDYAVVTRDRTGPPYLDLKLSSCSQGVGICGGEVMSTRADFWYGHYRFLAYVPDMRSLRCPQGFVFGLFTYKPPTDPEKKNQNEIDIEFLRRTLKHGASCKTNKDTFDRIYRVAHLPGGRRYPPLDSAFKIVGTSHLGHLATYGFDWAPNKITFFMNGAIVGEILGAENVPQQPSYLMFNTWTGADDSGGLTPPAKAIHSRVYSVGYTPDYIPSQIVCYLDQTCYAGNKRQARSITGSQCVSIDSCSALWKCEAGARGGSCGGGIRDCTFSPGCSQGVQTCLDGFCTTLSTCTDRIKFQGQAPNPNPNQCPCTNCLLTRTSG